MVLGLEALGEFVEAADAFAQRWQRGGEGAGERGEEVALGVAGDEDGGVPGFDAVIESAMQERGGDAGAGERGFARTAGTDDADEGAAADLLLAQALEDIAGLLIAAEEDGCVLNVEDLQAAVGRSGPQRGRGLQAEQVVNGLPQMNMQPLCEADRFAIGVVGAEVAPMLVVEALMDELLHQLPLAQEFLQRVVVLRACVELVTERAEVVARVGEYERHLPPALLEGGQHEVKLALRAAAVGGAIGLGDGRAEWSAEA